MKKRPEAQPFEGELVGIRVLVVEDEFFVADELSHLLAAHGAEVLGPAPDMHRAVALLTAPDIDCAVLDIDLNGEAVFPIVKTLEERDIPWIYVSGLSDSLVPSDMRGHAHIEKPIVTKALLAALISVTR